MVKYRLLNYLTDLDEAVNLINNNLNPNQTSDFLRWKHHSNPFGNALGAVALRNDKIIAVVFYMPYIFKNNKGKLIKGLRPVDGCTSKDYRGQGIFKKLMKFCLDLFKDDYDLLLATPNNNSYPEFLKLGWKVLKSDYFFKIGVLSPYRLFQSINLIDHPKKNIPQKILNPNNFFTTGNYDNYLNWRYVSNEYNIKEFSYNNASNFIIYRIERIRGFQCIVLCDYVGSLNLIDQMLYEISKVEKIYLVYYVSNKINNNLKFIFSITLRETQITYKESNFDLKEEMVLSLADLEGRI